MARLLRTHISLFCFPYGRIASPNVFFFLSRKSKLCYTYNLRNAVRFENTPTAKVDKLLEMINLEPNERFKINNSLDLFDW